jgi:hypothetical protein
MSDTTSSLIASMIEKPEYQKTIQRLMQVPPAVKAILQLSPADEAYMQELSKQNIVSRKLGSDKQQFVNNLSVAQGKLAIERDIKLPTQNTLYNMHLTGAQNTLDMADKQRDYTNVLGALNLGVSAFRANTVGKQNDMLTNLYMSDLKKRYNIGV